VYKIYIAHHIIPGVGNSDYLKLKMKCMYYLLWELTEKKRQSQI